nr:hypothetical protein [Tanacetum cinerariifolium]
MDMTIDQQVALDESIIPHASRLKIGKSNFHLKSNIYSIESTLQLTNVDFAYLLWEDFVYQVKHKDVKKTNEMHYPRFTKVIVHYFMFKDPSIPRRNRFGAMLPIELTNADIRKSEAYKEYYAVATGATPTKTKASVWKTKSSSDTTVTPPPTIAAGIRLSTSAKGKQPAKASKEKSLTVISEVAMTEEEQLKLAMKRSLHVTICQFQVVILFLSINYNLYFDVKLVTHD